MTPDIERLKQRRIQVHEIQAGTEFVKVTVEMPSPRETRIGISVALAAQSPPLDSRDIDVCLLDCDRFNPVGFPREGPLPELEAGGLRGAVATFRFEAVGPRSRPKGMQLKLRGRSYQILFRGLRSGTNGRAKAIPASV